MTLSDFNRIVAKVSLAPLPQPVLTTTTARAPPPQAA